MEHTEASIEISRGKLGVQIAVSMPFWTKNSLNESTSSVTIPLLGLRTYAEANNEQDINASIEEASKCFFIASEKFGKGIEKELMAIGWKEIDNSLEFMREDPILEQIMDTGDQYADKLELEMA